MAVEEVTDEQRQRAKAINFGIIYGQSSYGLAKALDIRRFSYVAYVGIRQHTSAYVSIRQHTSAYVSKPAKAPGHQAFLLYSIRQHTSAYVSIRQHTSAYVRKPAKALDMRRSSYIQ